MQATQEAAEKLVSVLEEDKEKLVKQTAEELADAKAEHEAALQRLAAEQEKAQVCRRHLR